MIFNKPHTLTKIEIWSPRYSDKHKKELAEPVVLLAKYKVDSASPWVIVEFTRAKHLLGQRYCIKRSEAQSHKLDSNSKIPCYAIPMSKFEYWTTVEEEKQVIAGFGW